MIPFLRPCRAAAPRMTRGRSPVPGPCGRRAAAGSRSRGRPVQGMAHPPCGDGPRSRGRPVHGRVGRAAVPWLPAPAGVPLGARRRPPCGDGFPLPRASRTGRGASAVRRWAPAPAGVPRHHPPLNLRRDGFPLPRASPAALPVRPCAGALLRPPHFHHSIWKANDKPAPPNVMISLRFPAAGAEKKRASPPARTFLLFTSPHVHAVPCIAIASRLAFTIL